MFTGIIEELGTIESVEHNATGINLHISANTVLDDVTLGASIAVNGCCLTVVEFEAKSFRVNLVEESLRRTSFSTLAVGDKVNLERPVRLNARLDGHLVQGHVDALGTIEKITQYPDGSSEICLHIPENISKYIVEKGSIAIDGISLTVAAIQQNRITIALIPHTKEMTTLGIKTQSDSVHLEVDVLAKYVEKLMQPHKRTS